MSKAILDWTRNFPSKWWLKDVGGGGATDLYEVTAFSPNISFPNLDLIL